MGRNASDKDLLSKLQGLKQRRMQFAFVVNGSNDGDFDSRRAFDSPGGHHDRQGPLGRNERHRRVLLRREWPHRLRDQCKKAARVASLDIESGDRARRGIEA